MISPAASGIECATEKNSTLNGPTCTVSPTSTVVTCVLSSRRCSFSFTSTSPRVSRVQKTGTFTSRSRKGSAPMWSSWPCVRKTAFNREGSRMM